VIDILHSASFVAAVDLLRLRAAVAAHGLRRRREFQLILDLSARRLKL
jgi:hypothetical protein